LIPRSSINIKDAIRDVLTARDQVKAPIEEEEEEEVSAPPRPTLKPTSGMSPQRALIVEIENAVRGGKIALKKVDTEAEMEKRKKDKEQTRFQQVSKKCKCRNTY
jgi:hypothetical protein